MQKSLEPDVLWECSKYEALREHVEGSLRKSRICTKQLRKKKTSSTSLMYRMIGD